ncbi:sugar-binding protein [Salmonella enterica subsp. enterica serovar Kua]|nr:sugar-binding protein [Salmonella enterica subsp. houtenae serovar 44:z4,z23:-]EIB9775165.1 sugar-binding protein [Salmonella enterica subsp. enterica serovar Kua]
MSTESNIIIDGDFEEGFDGWVLSSQSSIFVEDGATVNNHFCRIEPTNTITQYFTIEPETTYRLTLAVRGEAKGNVTIFQTYPAHTSFISDINTNLNAEWHREEYAFTTSADTGRTAFRISVPWNSTNTPMDIDIISLIEVPFEYSKPLWVNMTNVSSNSNFFQLNVMTRTDAPEGQINRIYRNGNYVTQMDAVGPDDFNQTGGYSSFAAGDVFQFRAYNSLTGKEYLLYETTYEQLTASGVFNIE